MIEENINHKSRLKNIDETRNYLIDKIKENELISKKHKNICTTLKYIEHLLILPFTMNGCVSVSAFSSVVGIPIGITISGIG